MIHEQRPEKVREQAHHAAIEKGDQRGNKGKGIKVGAKLVCVIDRLTAFKTPINGFPVDIPSEL